MHLFYLTEIVVDINVFMTQHQELDEFVDYGQCSLDHGYVESSVKDTCTQKIDTVNKCCIFILDLTQPISHFQPDYH